MDDSSESLQWLVLLHQLPPKPDYLRVRIRRRLAQIGAVALKNAAYVLPHSEQALEDFQWLVRDIEGAGGHAIVMTSHFVAGVEDTELVEAFHAQHAEAYADVAAEARVALEWEVVRQAAAVTKLRR